MVIADIHQLFLKHSVVCTDTRKLIPGSIFFALKGDTFNGNEFAAKAIESGCSFAVIDEEKYHNQTSTILVKNVLTCLQELAAYHRNYWGKKVIGLTGSNGKTTTKELLHSVLSAKYNCLATYGNLNNHIGVPLTLLQLKPEHELAIIEMGANHQKEIELLCSIAQPQYGVITNIGKAHLEGFGGEAGVLKGKGELYDWLRNKNGTIFINADDEKLSSISYGLKKFTYGFSSLSEVRGEMVDSDVFLTVNVQVNADKVKIASQLTGKYNAHNILCAAAVGIYFQIDLETIKKSLESYLPDNNRSQVKKTNFNTVIMDAYNANPSSMQLAIENLSQINAPNKYFILGDMREMGEYASIEHKHILEKLKQTGIDGILIGSEFMRYKNEYPFKFFALANEAIAYLQKNKIQNSTILVKGSRGIKLETVFEYL